MNALGPGMAVVQALGWCLLHFVWQAALVGALYGVARVILPRGNPRYFAAMVAMILLAALPVLTGWHEFANLSRPIELGNVVISGRAGMAPATTVALPNGWLASLRALLPWLVLAWACGVAFLGARVARQWRSLRAIVRSAGALPVWQARARLLARRMGLKRAVRVLASARIATPILVGWLRPVVVVPLAMLARMPVVQVDLILAHELAHLRRLDHLANLFQLVVETLLFYHPVVHWISRDARNERELCCDALALRAGRGRRRDFVAALAGLEEFRAGHSGLALAASGGVLVERARFIAVAKPESRHGHAGLTIAGLALLAIAIALAVAWRRDMVRQRVQHVLASNSAMLVRSLGHFDAPAPVLRELPGSRPALAPVPFAAVLVPVPRTVATAIRTVPAARLPLSSVPDIDAAIEPMTPVATQPASRASDAKRSSAATTARAIHVVQPVYPPQALLRGAQGRVEVQFTLTVAGVPAHLQVVDSSGSGPFDAAALSAMARWRFVPPATPGRQYRQTFTFRLGGAADGAARDCLPSTGTHVCRHAFDAQPGVRVLRSDQ